MRPLLLFPACTAFCAPRVLGGCATETPQALALSQTKAATLDGKVLDLAIREAADSPGEAVDAGVLPALPATMH